MRQGQIALEQSWFNRLSTEFEKPYMVELKKFLIDRKGKGKKIFPPGKHIFRAFEKTPFDAVKVVILGQDPYHGAGQANGLAFSVSRKVPLPPSLKNIFKEGCDPLIEMFKMEDHGHDSINRFCYVCYVRSGAVSVMPFSIRIRGMKTNTFESTLYCRTILRSLKNMHLARPIPSGTRLICSIWNFGVLVPASCPPIKMRNRSF